MTGTMPERAAKPLLEPTRLTEGYWAAAQEQKLAIQRCSSCRTWIHFPQPQCPACGATDLSFEPVSGRGVVATYTVIHRTFVQGFAEDVPYVAAWIDLPEQEGLRVFANITGTPPDAVHIGMKVEVFFERRGDRLIPNFRALPGP